MASNVCQSMASFEFRIVIANSLFSHSSKMLGEISKTPRARKRAQELSREREKCAELTEVYKNYQDENSEILLALKQYTNTNTLGRKLLVACGICLARAAGIPEPGHQEKRRRIFILGRINRNSELLQPYVGELVSQDEQGNCYGKEEKIGLWQKFKADYRYHPVLNEALKYLAKV
jgi:hypothetical protein